MENIVHEFLSETRESLDRLEIDLVSLEKEPNSQDILGNVFRMAHNIKGSSGILGFSKLESIAHAGENLLGMLRSRKLVLTPRITDALLGMADAIRHIISSIESNGVEDEKDYSEVIMTLESRQVPETGEEGTSAERTRLEKEVETIVPEAEKEEEEKNKKGPAKGKVPPKRDLLPELLETARLAAVVLPQETARLPKIVLPQGMGEQKMGQPASFEEAVMPTRSKPDILESKEAQETVPPQNPSASEEPWISQSISSQSSILETNIRVNVGLLDRLMNLVGELVLVRNQILQFSASHLDSGFAGMSQRLNLITSELQEGIMKTRMQPIDNIWHKFSRLVRDMASTMNKKVSLEMEGRETELDRTLLEAIKDPLVHLVRNAIDHGIEAPDHRASSGKPEEGRIRLSAFHEGGHVNIEVTDDGGGIDLERIQRKAVQGSWISHEQSLRMTERELVDMIWKPGFSCAEKVTHISGRGVGMDVVKTNIERIGGTVDVQSKTGQGCTFKIKIPLTLAIIPALMVTCDGDRYAIPQASLLELVRLEGKDVSQRIEMIHNAPVYRLRGNLLPLVYLDRELGVAEKENRERLNIVVLRIEKSQFGLVVDKIDDTQEIVVKPLTKQLKGISVFAGATILGDGRVSLILDILGIAQKANIVSATQEHLVEKRTQAPRPDLEKLQTLLLFKIGDDRRIGIPLSRVARLEKFSSTEVEKAAGCDVVYHRDRILPLLYLSEILGLKHARDPRQKMHVVVYNDGKHLLGLVVERILDIVQEPLHLQRCENRTGILGSAPIQGHITDILDLQAIIRIADPPVFEQTIETETRI